MINMIENVENVCEICSQEISEDNRASFTNGHTSNADVKRVICNECFGSLHCESSEVKLEIPITSIESNTDSSKVSCETDLCNLNQCEYSTIDPKTLVPLVVIHRDNHDEVTIKEEVSVKDEDLEDINLLELVEINADIHKIMEEPCVTNILNCHYCSYSTDNQATLMKHFQWHKENGVTKISSKYDVDSSTMPSSDFKKNGEKHYNWDIYDYSSANSDDLKHHMRTHLQQPYKCKLCNFSSAQFFNLKQHMFIHSGKKVHKCKLCDYSSATLNQLKHHMYIHTDAKSYKCEVCDYSTAYLSSLKIHFRRHTAEKPYKCKICDYSSKQLWHVKCHMLIHTGEKLNKCKICDFSSALGSLKQHMQTHIGEKLYKCEVCDYSSSDLSSLKKHILSKTCKNPFKHTGGKVYKCNVCGYSTATAYPLKQHVQTHTGEKPYKCKVCDYSCVSSSQLRRHNRTHTGEKPYECKICDFSSAYLESIKAHMYRHN